MVALDPTPGPPRLGQRDLDQVFSGLLLTGQQHSRAMQRRPSCDNEVDESPRRCVPHAAQIPCHPQMVAMYFELPAGSRCVSVQAQEVPHRRDAVNLQIEPVANEVAIVQSQLLADGKLSWPPLFPEQSVG